MTKKRCQHMSESQWLVKKLNVTRKLCIPKVEKIHPFALAFLQMKGVMYHV